MNVEDEAEVLSSLCDETVSFPVDKIGLLKTVEEAAWHTGALCPAAPHWTQNVGRKELLRDPSRVYGWKCEVLGFDITEVCSLFGKDAVANRSLRVWVTSATLELMDV